MSSVREGQFAKGIVNRLVVPKSVREIGDRAFKEWDMLRTVEFCVSGKLAKLGRECFAGSGLKELTVPKSVVTIERDAFCKCESLKRITFVDS